MKEGPAKRLSNARKKQLKSSAVPSPTALSVRLVKSTFRSQPTAIKTRYGAFPTKTPAPVLKNVVTVDPVSKSLGAMAISKLLLLVPNLSRYCCCICCYFGRCYCCYCLLVQKAETKKE